ncbi:dienelactone hydrolase family protein [Caulobacter sp. BK020]|uniref:dienelactone hydrolase family protein n=1 Tax=Caulobacter sp. BK020 TaxID=2512117 RepID=UPI001046D324|nr:dienelactone hydrolase family protein [Caulobacter sp. BK020]TCS12844.1 dienelactone hydrolase family protein [Caulobacter sp. BK020]
MPKSNDAALAGFTRFAFDDGRWTRPVYRIGSGPAVIVIHEIPGLHPQVLAFARDVAAEGMTVFCPSLFGKPGKPASNGYVNATLLKLACVGREFTIWASGRSSPIVDWLRALARKVHVECGGQGVGVVGMCFTGGFALAMMTEPSVVAPVLAEPSLPAGRKKGVDLDCSPAELAVAKARMEAEDLSLIALRFANDKLSPCARFQTLERELGPRAELHTLPDASARQGTGRAPHSVLTIHLNRDDPDGETMKVHRRVLDFFRERTGA